MIKLIRDYHVHILNDDRFTTNYIEKDFTTFENNYTEDNAFNQFGQGFHQNPLSKISRNSLKRLPHKFIHIRVIIYMYFI